jgi:TctA family transporter
MTVNMNVETYPQAKPLHGGDIAAILINTGDNASKIACTLATLGLKGGAKAVRNINTRSDMGAVAAGGSIAVCDALRLHTLKTSSSSHLFFALISPQLLRHFSVSHSCQPPQLWLGLNDLARADLWVRFGRPGAC